MIQKNNLRTSFGLSQQEQADYLQVSRSLLNMYENGKRTLPAHASIKLARLQIARQQLAATKQQEAQVGYPGPATCCQLLQDHVAVCTGKLYKLRRQLKAWQAKFSRLQARQQTLELICACSQPDCDAREEKWIAFNSFMNAQQLSSLDPGKVFMLQHRIDMQLAEIAATEKAIAGIGRG